ncbi:MAG: hypothetical protein WB770_05015 [Acidimicrobiales bacterium]
MSSLWTPEGEHRVGESGKDSPDRSRPAAGEQDETPPSDADVDALRRDLVEAPVEDIVANHCFGLFQLAALHLDEQPPNLDKARIAIDALGGIVETVGDRLGPHAEALRGALASIRLAFVELSKPSNGESPPQTPEGDEAAP